MRMGTLRALDALHLGPSQLGGSTSAIINAALLLLHAVHVNSWKVLPAGTEYLSSSAEETQDTAHRRQLKDENYDWYDVEFGMEEPPAWLADPYEANWPNTVAVCAIMKEENAKDVQEFLEYHRWVGVDSFFLREHGDAASKDVLKVLEPYERAGVLDFNTFPSRAPGLQTRWYNRCSTMAARKHAWVAFIDVDEFMVVLDKGRAVTERGALKTALRRSFRYTAAVSMQSVLFGSGGHETQPPSGQLAGFQRCTGVLSQQMKCLGNSFWFHKAATFLPKRTQQCTIRVGGVAVLGNSEPMPMVKVDMESHGHSPDDPDGPDGPDGRRILADNEQHLSEAERFDISATAATYMGHLNNDAYVGARDVTPRHQLVLFHYLTGSAEAFLGRKYARAGKFGAEFEAMVAESGGERAEVLGDFEAELGLDGESELCREGAGLAAAMFAARASGEWSPLPNREGGLLFQ